MSTPFHLARGRAEFEIDLVDRRFDLLVKEVENHGNDPAWIAHCALRSALETVIELSPEERAEFIEHADELLDCLRSPMAT